MSTKLLLIALSTFLCLSELANGGVMLYVHFGDTPQNPANENDLQTSLDASATSFVANYYVRLTEGSTIFAYRFSVRFDNDLLQFDSAEQDQFRPTIFVADSNLAAPTEQDQSTVAPILGFKELRRFHGYDESVLFPNSPLSPVRLEGDGFYKVATTSFTLRPGKSLTPGGLLVKPGRFDIAPKTGLFDPDVQLDNFDSDEMGTFFPQVFGGTVKNSTVPEPSSAIVLGSLGLLALATRRKR